MDAPNTIKTKIIQVDFGNNYDVFDQTLESSVVPEHLVPVFTEEELDPRNWTVYRDCEGKEFRINPEFKYLIPKPEEEELKELEVQLRAFGCREPLVTWRGMLLDGHNRLEICKEYTIPFKTVAYDDMIESICSARVWIRTNQMARRNLNAFVRARLVLENKADEAQEAKKRKLDGASSGGSKTKEDYGKKDVTTLSQGFSQGKEDQDNEEIPGRVRSRLAKQAGVSEGTLDKTEKILQSGNRVLIDNCEAGRISVNAAFMEIQKGKQRSEAELIGFPSDENYDVIYCDPYMRSCGDMPGWDWKELPISLNELPVKDAYEYQAMLFMWSPTVYLEDSLEIMQKWGFDYMDTIIWELTEPVENQRTFNKCILLLIGSAGGAMNEAEYKPLTLVKHNLAHEGKRYEQAREVIEKMFPDKNTKKLEMFSHDKKEGWDLFTGQSVE